MAWEPKANLKGAPGYMATGAAEDDLAISRFVEAQAGPTKTNDAIVAAASKQIATDVPPMVQEEAAAYLGSQPAVADAAAAAVGAEIAGRELAEAPDAADVPGLGFAVVDKYGNKYWLEAGTDGKPTARVVTLLQEKGVAAFGVSDSPNALDIIDSQNRVLLSIDKDYRLVNPVEANRHAIAPLAAPARTLLNGVTNQANKYTLNTYYPTKFGAQVGEYLTFDFNGQEGIRVPAMAGSGLGSGLASGTYSEAVTGITETDARATHKRLIGSLAYRHFANPGNFWGGTPAPWDEGENGPNVSAWQSAMWAFITGASAWLNWADFTPTEQGYVKAMVRFEADRFLNYKPKYWRNRAGVEQYAGDSKAEELSWNAQILALAYVLEPNHANSDAWLARMNEMLLAANAAPRDLTSGRVIHGDTLGDLLGGYNIRDDGMVINHGYEHPGYVTSACSNLACASIFAIAGMKVPLGTVYNVDLMYSSLTDVVFPVPIYDAPGGVIYKPDGTIYYPRGSTWGTGRVMDMAAFDVAAAVFGTDGLSTVKAGAWAELHLQKVADQQARSTTGQTYIDTDSETYYGREQLVANQAFTAQLAMLAGDKTVRFTNNTIPTIAMQNRGI